MSDFRGDASIDLGFAGGCQPVGEFADTKSINHEIQGDCPWQTSSSLVTSASSPCACLSRCRCKRRCRRGCRCKCGHVQLEKQKRLVHTRNNASRSLFLCLVATILLWSKDKTESSPTPGTSSQSLACLRQAAAVRTWAPRCCPSGILLPPPMAGPFLVSASQIQPCFLRAPSLASLGNLVNPAR